MTSAGGAAPFVHLKLADATLVLGDLVRVSRGGGGHRGRWEKVSMRATAEGKASSATRLDDGLQLRWFQKKAAWADSSEEGARCLTQGE